MEFVHSKEREGRKFLGILLAEWKSWLGSPFRYIPKCHCQGTANIGYVTKRRLFVLNPLLGIINKTSQYDQPLSLLHFSKN